MYVTKRVSVAALFAASWQSLLLMALVVCATTVVHEELLDAYLKLSIALTALGAAVSFFIAFFTGQAYDRWWEARKIWGDFVNESRSFGRLVMTIIPDDGFPIDTDMPLVREAIAEWLRTRGGSLDDTTYSDAASPVWNIDGSCGM